MPTPVYFVLVSIFVFMAFPIVFCSINSPDNSPLFLVPMGSPSRGGDVAVYVFDINQLSLPTLFYSVLVSISAFYGPFNCISFHKFSR